MFVCFLTVVMLKWFVDAEVAAGAIEHPRKLIGEDVEVRPERLPDAVLDENVDVNLIRKFFYPRCLVGSNGCRWTEAI